MSLLEVRALTMRFGGLTAVKQLDFAIEQGQILSVIGPNGAGKTTVFNVITGIYEPTEGSVRFEGSELARPFTGRVALGVALIGLLTGLLALVSLHLEALWLATVTPNYVFGQLFPWGQAFRDLGAFLARERLSVGLSCAVGAALGLAGAALVWRRQRRSPHLIAWRGLSRTFQNIRLFPGLSALENVITGMDARLSSRLWHAALRLPLYFREKRQARARALELLDFVGLKARAHVAARHLPYGEQRLLEIARALATGPRLLLLDEPAAGMNPSEAGELMKLIRRIRDTGVTVLLIEHHMNVVMGISDRIVVLDYGSKIAEGRPDEVRADPKVIAAYLGAGTGS